MPTLRQILDCIQTFAPWELAETWDNSGLQVGQADQMVRKILLAVDFNREVFEEGLGHQVDGYLVHHPLLFKPLHRIDLSLPMGNHIGSLIKHEQFLISAHTNIDKAQFGLNDHLAKLIELSETDALEPARTTERKIVTYVPEEAVDKVLQAMAEAGAGIIGDYSQCAFSTRGIGSFIPGETTNPVTGKRGESVSTSEIRLEMIVSEKQLPSVVKAIYNYHPYEEPVFDIYPLENLTSHGLGKIGRLNKPQTLESFCQKIKNIFNIERLKFSGDPHQIIQTIAICSGSGKSLIPTVLARKADLYLTADLSYHDYLTAAERGLALIELGHWTSEQYFVPLVAEQLGKNFPPNELQIFKSNATQGEPYQLI